VFGPEVLSDVEKQVQMLLESCPDSAKSYAVTPDLMAKSNAHSMCAQELSLHAYHTENEYKIPNVTNI
jgi:hypothetical protein